MPDSGMVTAATWVPRGFAAPFPKKYALDEAEFERISALAKLQLEGAQDDLEEAEEDEREKSRQQKSNGAKEGSASGVEQEEYVESEHAMSMP